MSFWAHLDVLRGVLIRCVIAWGIMMIGAFLLKDPLFSLLLAPTRSDFLTWRILAKCGFSLPTPLHSTLSTLNSQALISTELTGQFLTHVSISLWTGFIVALPYIIWQLYRFIQPAIGEQQSSKRIGICLSAVGLFFVGVVLNYFIIFPFAYRFLIDYQVSQTVVNMISLSSYIGTFLTLSLIMGVLFELPLLAWILASLGILEASVLRQYRKHAVVLIVILAAVITPTGDAFTLLLVSVPIYLLYELSIGIVERVNKKSDLPSSESACHDIIVPR